MPNEHTISLTRIWEIWGQAVALATPVAVENVLRTLMRTTDAVVAGTLSPAAVAAVGVGDSFSRIVNRIGGGLGDATIALSSQDTGAEAYGNRDEAIAQAFIIGFITGLPLVVFGLFFSHHAIELLGAEREVIQLGGQYLGLILIAAPMIHLSKIGAKSLQGIGDTKTPMYVRGAGNSLNIVGTVVLAFGFGPFPRLSVVGIASATVLGESITALLFLAVIYRPASNIPFVWPKQLMIGKQLVRISLPRIGEGGVVMFADLPFNAILLSIGTEATAAYHIARRIYQQIMAPNYRAFGVASNILVGQSLEAAPDQAFVKGVATAGLGLGIAGLLGILLFLGRHPLVDLFTNDPSTAQFGVIFVQAFVIAGFCYTAYSGIRGGLRGGSDTRAPFLATLIGLSVFLLAGSYLGVVRLQYGILAVCLALILDYAWRASFLGIVYYRRNWIDYGTQLMEDRGSVE